MRSLYFLVLIPFFSSEIAANLLDQCRDGKFHQYLASVQSGTHRCNGVIIDKNTVYTSGLCINDYVNRVPPNGCDCKRKITIKYYTVPSNLGNDFCSKSIGVRKTIFHPKFKVKDQRVRYDKAILKTEGDMELEPTWRPPVLSTAHWDKPICEEEALLTGYWFAKDQKVKLGHAGCMNVLVRKDLCHPNIGQVSPRYMCILNPNPMVKTICQAYYGAPVFCREKESKQIILYGWLSHRYNLTEICEDGVAISYEKANI